MATLLTNVRVFDGRQVLGPGAVGVIGPTIAPAGAVPDGARVTDCGGQVLLPGLIDAHVHLRGSADLRKLAGYGITTALDMGTWPVERLAGLRAAEDVTDIRSSGVPAVDRAGPHAAMPGFPVEAVVDGPDDARPYVCARVAEQVDHVKVVIGRPGRGSFDVATVAAIVAAAHAHGLPVVAHAVTVDGYRTALEAGVDVHDARADGPRAGRGDGRSDVRGGQGDGADVDHDGGGHGEGTASGLRRRPRQRHGDVAGGGAGVGRYGRQRGAGWPQSDAAR